MHFQNGIAFVFQDSHTSKGTVLLLSIPIPIASDKRSNYKQIWGLQEFKLKQLNFQNHKKHGNFNVIWNKIKFWTLSLQVSSSPSQYCSNCFQVQYLYICTVISPKAGWILIQCWHQMHIPAHPCTCIYLHMHMKAHTHKYTYSTPHTTTMSQELNGGGWQVPFPLHTAHNQVTMKCITWLKVGSTNLIYLHHPQADSKN
jgi:hypothetical protein